MEVNFEVASSILTLPQGCILTWGPQDLADPERACVTLIKPGRFELREFNNMLGKLANCHLTGRVLL